MIQKAADAGVGITISPKYWMEQMGMPFHPTHINRENQFDRRHGYANLLRYPQTYRICWRLWSSGTTRILLWGDPEYARRFVASTHLYDGDGFDVNEPLATKMASQPQDAKPFDLLNPRYRYYDYEFTLLAFLPGVRPHGLQPGYFARSLEAGIRTTVWRESRALGRSRPPPGELGLAADCRLLLSLRLLSHHAGLAGKATTRRSAAICQGGRQRHCTVRQF